MARPLKCHADAKKKKVKVKLPSLTNPDEMSEHEISYMDRVLIMDIEKLAAKGFTNDQIIEKLPISRDTFYKRLKSEPYFSYALYKHRGIAVQEVENALFKRSMGYTVQEKVTEAKPVQKIVDGKLVTDYELMTAKITEKTVEPDTNAIKFFLSNRNPEQWKMKVEPHQVAGAEMEKITFNIKRRGD